MTKRNSLQSSAKSSSVIIKRFKYAAPIQTKKLVSGLRPLSASRPSIKSQLGGGRASVQLKRNDLRNTITAFKRDSIPSQIPPNLEENSLTLHSQNAKKSKMSGFDVIRQTITKQTRTTLTARPSIKEDNTKEHETHPLRVQIQTYRDISNNPATKRVDPIEPAQAKVGSEVKSMQNSFHKENKKDISTPTINTTTKAPPVILSSEKNAINEIVPDINNEAIIEPNIPVNPLANCKAKPIIDDAKELEEDNVEVYDMDKKDESPVAIPLSNENVANTKNQFAKLAKMRKAAEPEANIKDNNPSVVDPTENQAARKLQKLFKKKKKASSIDDAAKVIQHLFKAFFAKAKLKKLRLANTEKERVIFKAFITENSIPYAIIISLQNMDKEFISLLICKQNTMECQIETVKGNLAKLNMEQVIGIVNSFSFSSANVGSIKTALEGHVVWEAEKEVAESQENVIEPLVDSSLQPLGIKDEMTNEMSSLEPLNMQSSISNNNLGQIESMHSKEDEDDGQLIEESIL